jgi:hypothetical protein
METLPNRSLLWTALAQVIAPLLALAVVVGLAAAPANAQIGLSGSRYQSPDGKWSVELAPKWVRYSTEVWIAQEMQFRSTSPRDARDWTILAAFGKSNEVIAWPLVELRFRPMPLARRSVDRIEKMLDAVPIEKVEGARAGEPVLQFWARLPLDKGVLDRKAKRLYRRHEFEVEKSPINLLGIVDQV